MHPALQKENPLSLSNLVNNKKFDEALETLNNKYPDLFTLTERELRREIKRMSTAPTPDDSMLRMKFWFEYDTAMAEGRTMHMNRICSGVMDQTYFWDYLSKPLKLAWILCPIPSYQQQLDEGLGAGMRKLRDILELPVVDEITGKINVSLITAQTRIILALDMRKHGAFTQKIENKNMHFHASANQVSEEIHNLSMEDVKKRLAKLDAIDRDSQLIEQKASRPTYTVESEVEDK